MNIDVIHLVWIIPVCILVGIFSIMYQFMKGWK